VVADPKDVTILDGLSLDSLSGKLDTIGRSHIYHVEIPARKLDERMLARHVGIADGQVRGSLAPSDHESIFVHLVWPPLVDDR
jgi:hypothetical protein